MSNVHTIINEYTIGNQKLTIEQSLICDDYMFRVIDLTTLKQIHESNPISNLITAREKAFEYMGVQGK